MILRAEASLQGSQYRSSLTGLGWRRLRLNPPHFDTTGASGLQPCCIRDCEGTARLMIPPFFGKDRLRGSVVLRCPKCGSRSTGRIGQDQFYCWDCNVEFHVQGSFVRIYSIDPEGAAVLESVRSPNETELGSIRDNTVHSFQRGTKS